MPVTRFVTCSIIMAGATTLPLPEIGESGQDCVLRLVETSRTTQPQFTLHGYIRNRVLGFPELAQHCNYNAGTGSVIWSTPLSTAENARLMTRLEAVTVPLLASSWPGTDGTWFTLAVERGSFAGSFRFSWWMKPPEGWESVGAVLGYMLELGESTFLASAQPTDVLSQAKGQINKMLGSLRK
ncbi:MAG: hypothetical protein U0350_20655 [Caldilineaceae bacterium]